MSPRLIRLAGGAAVVNLFLSLVVVLTTKDWSRLGNWRLFPTRNDSMADYASWYHEHEAAAFFQMIATNFGAMLLVFFTFGLAHALRLPLNSVLSLIMLGAALVFVVIALVTNGMFTVGVERVFQQTPAGHLAIKTSFEQAIYVLYSSMPVLALLLFAAAFANHRARTFPRWVTWTAVAAGFGNFAGPFILLVRTGWLAPAEIGALIPWALFWLWVPAVGVVMLRLPLTNARPEVEEPSPVAPGDAR